jgi:hypothetical protein
MFSHAVSTAAADVAMEVMQPEALLRTATLESAIFNCADFSWTAAVATGVVQIFTVGRRTDGAGRVSPGARKESRKAAAARQR